MQDQETTMQEDERTIGHKLAIAEIRKADDALGRAFDGLDVSTLDNTSLAYVLKQIAIAMAFASAARSALEGLQVKRGVAIAKELARARLADPTYTPSINEVLDNPDGFMDGFREG